MIIFKNYILALIFLSFIPKISFACSCPVQTPLDFEGELMKKRYMDYSSIVLAKVDSVEKILIPRIKIDGSVVKDDGERTDFSSIKTWKGDHGKNFHTKITSSGASCGIRFKPKETYLLFLNKSEKGNHYTTSICSGNLPEHEARDYISALDKFAYERLITLRPAIYQPRTYADKLLKGNPNIFDYREEKIDTPVSTNNSSVTPVAK